MLTSLVFLACVFGLTSASEVIRIKCKGVSTWGLGGLGKRFGLLKNRSDFEFIFRGEDCFSMIRTRKKYFMYTKEEFFICYDDTVLCPECKGKGKTGEGKTDQNTCKRCGGCGITMSTSPEGTSQIILRNVFLKETIPEYLITDVIFEETNRNMNLEGWKDFDMPDLTDIVGRSPLAGFFQDNLRPGTSPGTESPESGAKRISEQDRVGTGKVMPRNDHAEIGKTPPTPATNRNMHEPPKGGLFRMYFLKPEAVTTYFQGIFKRTWTTEVKHYFEDSAEDALALWESNEVTVDYSMKPPRGSDPCLPTYRSRDEAEKNFQDLCMLFHAMADYLQVYTLQRNTSRTTTGEQACKEMKFFALYLKNPDEAYGYLDFTGYEADDEWFRANADSAVKLWHGDCGGKPAFTLRDASAGAHKPDRKKALRDFIISRSLTKTRPCPCVDY